MDVPRAGTRTARGRQLAARMRALRESAGLSRRQVTEQLGLASSTLYRIEAGQAAPQGRTLRGLLDLYQVEDQPRADLLALAEGASSSGGWLHAYSDVLPEKYLDYVGFEADADTLSEYESLLIPGLVQTEAYARAVIAGSLHRATADELERRVEVRLQRQDVLAGDDPVHLHAIFDEAALWRVVGSGAVMAAQLRSLTTVRENVKLQVIPYGAGAHPGMIGSFVVMHFGDLTAPDLVYIESMAGELFRESETDLTRYRDIFEHLKGQALSVEDSATLIETVARKHKRGGQ